MRLVIALGCVVLAGCPSGSGPSDGVCLRGSEVEKLRACLDGGQGPDACVKALSAPLCDSDWDGLGDDLELALAQAYAPAFAFNSGAYAGNPETNWPGNAKFFVASSSLYHRVEGEDPPGRLVSDAPTLETLADFQATAPGTTVAASASNPALKQGPDFFLCLKSQTDQTHVATKQVMISLADGVDLAFVAHPANGRFAPSTHLFLSFGLFFPYNEFAVVDEHEGDWESIGVFVNRATGAVDAAFFGRHETKDPIQFVDRATYGAKSAASESAPYPQIDDTTAAPHGLRFHDFGGKQHHVVAYVSTGSHAMYDYPGFTEVKIPVITVRDTHDGELDKLLPWSGLLVQSWTAATGTSVRVNVQNPGEATKLTLPWARFRGQWGCTDEVVAKSWPGPFGNGKFARPELERVWGSPPKAP